MSSNQPTSPARQGMCRSLCLDIRRNARHYFQLMLAYLSVIVLIYIIKNYTGSGNDVNSADDVNNVVKYSDVKANTPAIGALTGAYFPGTVIRDLPSSSFKNTHSYIAKLDTFAECHKWAVVTTVYEPSKAVSAMAAHKDWCMVIVADKKTPSKQVYLDGITKDADREKRIKYFTIAEQRKLYPFLCDAIPYSHFGRKNIGFMYAMHHKAKVIWDFDDDNEGHVNVDDYKIDDQFSFVTVCRGKENRILNPYPYFGVNETYTWPRGIPLQTIRDRKTVPKLCNAKGAVKLGLVQSLANKEPDVDAIYRLTRDIPFNFRATVNSHKPYVLPKGSYTPFNAQATLWFPSGYPYMALPLTVSARVSDIWRSYIAEYFLYMNNFQIAFSPPYVIQDRNAHDFVRDLNAERDLYERSQQFVDYLATTNREENGNIVDIYQNLYKRGYIEYQDVQFAIAWHTTLEHLNLL